MKWWPFGKHQPKYATVFTEVILTEWPWPEDDPVVMDLGSLGEALEAAIVKEQLGQWTGDGQMLDGSYFNFDFEFMPDKLAAGIKVLREELLRLKAAASTYIQTGDPDNRIYDLVTGASRKRTDRR